MRAARLPAASSFASLNPTALNLGASYAHQKSKIQRRRGCHAKTSSVTAAKAANAPLTQSIGQTLSIRSRDTILFVSPQKTWRARTTTLPRASRATPRAISIRLRAKWRQIWGAWDGRGRLWRIKKPGLKGWPDMAASANLELKVGVSYKF